MLTRESREARMTALTRLALRTREKVERETLILYLEDTARFSTEVMVEACERIGKSQDWFPKAHELLAECEVVGKQHQERREAEQRAKQLGPKADPERLKRFIEDVKAVVAKKGMPQ